MAQLVDREAARRAFDDALDRTTSRKEQASDELIEAILESDAFWSAFWAGLRRRTLRTFWGMAGGAAILVAIMSGVLTILNILFGPFTLGGPADTGPPQVP